MGAAIFFAGTLVGTTVVATIVGGTMMERPQIYLVATTPIALWKVWDIAAWVFHHLEWN